MPSALSRRELFMMMSFLLVVSVADLLGSPRVRAAAPSQQPAEGAEVEIQVFLRQPKVVSELLHPLLERHQRLTESLDLVTAQPTGLYSPYRLPFHQLPEQLDQRQHELR
jgi:hypothetical protein